MTAVHMPSRSPGRKVFHDDWPQTPYGSNSHHGPHLAESHKCGWIDNDATRTSNDVLINDHGNPLRAYFRKGDRSIHHTWAQVQQLTYDHAGETYRLRSIAQALKDNAALGIRTEVEIKYLGPISKARLDAILRQLAADAEAAYGADWRAHAEVKVLSNLTGGVNYALRVCRAAHAAGFTTILLARGTARFRRFKGRTAVTYVRGSAVIR
jgi:hypothetical protein